jgi:hypothetical protein
VQYFINAEKKKFLKNLVCVCVVKEKKVKVSDVVLGSSLLWQFDGKKLNEPKICGNLKSTTKYK